MGLPKYGIYGYCVVLSETPLTFEKTTMGTCTSTIRTIHHQDIAMVVSRASYILPPNRKNVFAHQQVIGKVMESHTVLPLSFGNVFRSEKDVVLLLEKLYDEVHELIPRLENKYEMGLKLYAKQEWLDQEVESNKELATLKKKLEKTSPEGAYYERIRGGEIARDFFIRLQQQITEHVYNPLSAIAELAKLNDPIGDRGLLNAAFLINKEDEPSFDSKVTELHEKWRDKLEFKYTGPWPAYNFVNIRITVE